MNLGRVPFELAKVVKLVASLLDTSPSRSS